MKKLLTILFTIGLSAITFAQNLEVFFNEQFDDNSRAWFEATSEDREAKVGNGVYKLYHKRKTSSWNFNYPIYFDHEEDYEIEAAIRHTIGVTNYGFGIQYGYKDWENYNQFSISANGYFLVNKRENNDKTELVQWTKCKQIKPSGAINVLKIHKKGKKIRFYVNGVEVHKMKAPDFYGNKIAFQIDNKQEIEVEYLIIRKKLDDINLVADAIQNRQKENLGSAVNTKYEDLGPIISPDGNTLYFFRKEHPDNKGTEDKDDIWFSTKNDDNTWSRATNLGRPVNNKGHNFLASISPDGTRMLLNNTYTTAGEILGSGFSISKKKATGWSIPTNLKIADYENEAKTTSSCMTPDQKAIIMSIQTNEARGEHDLFISFHQSGNNWSKPKHMGTVINSAGNEMSPFMAADNKTLYFSSDGFAGFGDNDIFVSRRLDDSWTKWSKPKNLGPEINTDLWDAYFSVPASGEEAYLVSQFNSIGQGDIFRIKMSDDAKPEPVVLIKGRVLNRKTGDPLAADISYRDLNTNQELGVAHSDPATGRFEIVLPSHARYSFFAHKEGFYSQRDSMDLQSLTTYKEFELDLLLSPIEVGSKVTLKNIFFSQGKSNLLPESYPELDHLVSFLDKNPGVEIFIEGHTDNVGSADLNLQLSKDRVQVVMNYLQRKGIAKRRLDGEGYGGSKPIADNRFEHTRRLNRRVEFRITKK